MVQNKIQQDHETGLNLVLFFLSKECIVFAILIRCASEFPFEKMKQNPSNVRAKISQLSKTQTFDIKKIKFSDFNNFKCFFENILGDVHKKTISY